MVNAKKKIRKHRSKLIAGVIFIAVLFGFTEYYIRTDEQRPFVELFIRQNMDLVSVVGNIESMSLKRLTVIGADGSGDREYFYHVQGSTKSAYVTIVAERLTSSDNHYKYRAIDLEFDD